MENRNFPTAGGHKAWHGNGARTILFLPISPREVPTMAVRVVIAEDQTMIRELLAALLAREPGIVVVGEAANGREAIEATRRLAPDLVVLDVGLPDMDGAEVARSLKRLVPGPKVLALSIHTDSRHVRGMLEAGSDGYVVKSSTLSELVRALRAVAEGKVYLSPEIAREALRERLLDEPSALGRRERQVLALLAEGKRSYDIAAQLGISPATVDAHRRNIMRKLGLHTVAELTKYALRKGLTSP
jgi:DNA-binding NarL/FixJ family response regulator